MHRRTFLSSAGLATLGFTVQGCATWSTVAGVPRLRLPVVRASWDRVIRTTVGLRPHRDGGFVVRTEKQDDKVLVHNYGHGGSGMSLSWGTGAMAADLALQQPGRRAAVLGCGAVGLTAARQLQRRGFDVTIYATAVPPDVTSNWSLAGFTPTSGLIEPERRTAEFDAQYRQAVDIAYRQLQLLAGAGYGVSWIEQFAPMNEPPQNRPTSEQSPLDEFQPPSQLLGPGEHPFPTKYATRRASMRIEPSIYLEALIRDFRNAGGHIVIRKFDTPRDLMLLAEPLIVNCTGLGSRDLFNDQDMTPVKGQLTLLVPQPEIAYQTSGGINVPSTPGIGIHMMPRSDGIALGGTSIRDDWSTTVNEIERQRIVDAHIDLFDRMRGVRRT